MYKVCKYVSILKTYLKVNLIHLNDASLNSEHAQCQNTNSPHNKSKNYQDKEKVSV